jgi:predicted aspartyl protease
MKFRGSIQGLELLILLDSGSSHTFLTASVATQLTGCSPVDVPMPVQVANGHNLLCSSELRETVWFLNEYQF